MTYEKILSGYPDLTEEDIRACLVYAADPERRLVTNCPMKLLFDQNLSFNSINDWSIVSLN